MGLVSLALLLGLLLLRSERNLKRGRFLVCRGILRNARVVLVRLLVGSDAHKLVR